MTTTAAEHYYRQPGRPEAPCRHCAELLVQLESRVWVDTWGFIGCMKADALTFSTREHEPMPEVTP